MGTQNGKSTQNRKVTGSNHTVALGLALVPNVIMRVPVRVESDMCRDENRVSDATALSVAQNWLWGNQITDKKKRWM